MFSFIIGSSGGELHRFRETRRCQVVAPSCNNASKTSVGLMDFFFTECDVRRRFGSFETSVSVIQNIGLTVC